MRWSSPRRSATQPTWPTVCGDLRDARGHGRGREGRPLVRGDDLFQEEVGLRFDALVTGQDFHEPHLSLARAQLEDQAWAAAWSEGREMGFEQVVAYALEGEETK
jgi:hypothetical protein